MRNYLICLLIFFSSCKNTKKKKIPQITNHEIATLEINNFPVVDCGNLALSYSYIFKIDSNDSLILGIIRCPDGYDSGFFKKNDKYIVNLSKDHLQDSLEHYPLANQWDSNNYPVYLVSTIEKLNK